jgi:hypothetical protein
MAQSGVAADVLSHPVGAPAVQIERALQLCQAAERAAYNAAGIRADSRRRRSERRHWEAIQAAYRTGSGEVMRCCAYCARMPGPDGSWAAIPQGVSQSLHSRICRAPHMSHGYCPDCLPRHFHGGRESL